MQPLQRICVAVYEAQKVGVIPSVPGLTSYVYYLCPFVVPIEDRPGQEASWHAAAANLGRAASQLGLEGRCSWRLVLTHLVAQYPDAFSPEIRRMARERVFAHEPDLAV